MPDRDGYPTPDELERVATWPHTDPLGWMEYIRLIWWQEGWGWRQFPEGLRARYEVSTGGWSGNEQIIQAMADNQRLWVLTWQSTRRGGHYEFEAPSGGGPGG